MADDAAPPAEGEMSKNQLKKLQKAKEAAEKKAAKAAANAEKAAAGGPKKAKLGGDDEELDPTKYYENRITGLGKLSVCGNDIIEDVVKASNSHPSLSLSLSLSLPTFSETHRTAAWTCTRISSTCLSVSPNSLRSTRA